MILSKIYSKFTQPKILQTHQLRVAGVGYLLAQKYNLPNLDIVKALAVHDLGNIVRIKFGLFPNDCEPEGIEYWQRNQKNYIEKYGKTDHEATIKMLQEIGISLTIQSLVKSVNTLYIEDICKGDNLSLKILNYADMRVGPLGVLSAIERIEEGKKRNPNWEGYENLRKLIVVLEKQIFENLDITPEYINDSTVQEVIPKFKDIDIN